MKKIPILWKIERALNKRKDKFKEEDRRTNKGNFLKVKKFCSYCGHGKAIKKGYGLMCTKCKRLDNE